MRERPGSWPRALRVALGFLTTLPVPQPATWRDDDLRHAVRAYPVVGLVLGVALGAVALLGAVVPPAVVGAVVTVVWLVLTGALHLDGVCDVADAALAPLEPERRWEVLRDPRVGSFGLAAGAGVLLLKASAAGALAAAGGDGALLVLLVPVVARTAVVWAMAAHPVGDASLLGRSSRLAWRETGLPLATGAALLAAGGAALRDPVAPLLLAVVAAAVVVAVARLVVGRMGGLGGDAYGALVEVDEAVLLAVASALVR